MLEKYGRLIKPRNYEMVYAIIPTLREKEANDYSSEIIDELIKMKCRVFHKERWKLKTLAYPIRKFTTAYFYLINFETTPDKIEEINKLMFSRESILRHLIVRMDKHHLEYRLSRIKGAGKKKKETEKPPAEESGELQEETSQPTSEENE